eukprot:SAG31_NODE_566_length_14037_cov_32.372148_9_plen_553_part_00
MADVGPPRPPADSDDDAEVGPPRPPPADDSDDDQVGPPRPPTDSDIGDSDVGPPRPLEDGGDHVVPKKRRKKDGLEFEQLYLDALPSCEMYEKSYMHRGTVTDVLVTPNEFIVTASMDGTVKFWKKAPAAIEFVKHFRAHLEPITGMCASADGAFLATVSSDRSLKIYDVQNFDMISMLKLGYLPGACQWVSKKGAADGLVAVSEHDSAEIRIYRARAGVNDAVRQGTAGHSAPVRLIGYNAVNDVAVSIDQKGMVEYWDPETFDFPAGKVAFKYKAETSLYEFAKKKTIATSIAFSRDGAQFVCVGADRQVRVFHFRTGKMRMQYDEGLAVYQRLQQDGSPQYHLDPIDFGRRVAMEQTNDSQQQANAVFDESGNFILYSTMLGIKVVNIKTHQVARLLGKVETNERFVKVALYQGKPKRPVGLSTTLGPEEPDPTIFCTSSKKNRFFYFSTREPPEEGRDVFNERPTKDDLAVVLEETSAKSKVQGVIIRTTMGDIHCKLYPEECPRTIENFVTHSKNGYYNGVMFHRVIKSFMLQVLLSIYIQSPIKRK